MTMFKENTMSFMPRALYSHLSPAVPSYSSVTITNSLYV